MHLNGGFLAGSCLALGVLVALACVARAIKGRNGSRQLRWIVPSLILVAVLFAAGLARLSGQNNDAVGWGLAGVFAAFGALQILGLWSGATRG